MPYFSASLRRRTTSAREREISNMNQSNIRNQLVLINLSCSQTAHIQQFPNEFSTLLPEILYQQPG